VNDSSWSRISLKLALLCDLLCPITVCGLEMGDRCAAFLSKKKRKKKRKKKGEGRRDVVYHMQSSVKGRMFI
jgi:hypothetical protein